MYRGKGFTLVELMIAISILSMLMFTGSYVYSTLSVRWDKELGHFDESMQAARAFDILQRLLDGTMPYVVTENASPDSKPSYFFIGDKDSLLAVSRQGLYAEGFPEIYRLTAVRNKEGTLDLVYQAKSVQNFLLLGTHQEVTFDYQKTLMKGLAAFEFSYFGYADFTSKNFVDDGDDRPAPEWTSRFSGIERQLIPDKIAVSLQKDNQQISFVNQLDGTSQRFIEHYISAKDDS